MKIYIAIVKTQYQSTVMPHGYKTYAEAQQALETYTSGRYYGFEPSKTVHEVTIDD